MFSPFYHKLLPDSEDPSQKTLVLNLNKTLITYNYKLGTGFEITKRPGLNRFLLELSNYYEIVIFGTEDSGVSFMIIIYSLLRIFAKKLTLIQWLSLINLVEKLQLGSYLDM